MGCPWARIESSRRHAILFELASPTLALPRFLRASASRPVVSRASDPGLTIALLMPVHEGDADPGATFSRTPLPLARATGWGESR